jgi:hypothetical protein
MLLYCNVAGRAPVLSIPEKRKIKFIRFVSGHMHKIVWAISGGMTGMISIEADIGPLAVWCWIKCREKSCSQTTQSECMQRIYGYYGWLMMTGLATTWLAGSIIYSLQSVLRIETPVKSYSGIQNDLRSMTIIIACFFAGYSILYIGSSVDRIHSVFMNAEGKWMEEVVYISEISTCATGLVLSIFISCLKIRRICDSDSFNKNLTDSFLGEPSDSYTPKTSDSGPLISVSDGCNGNMNIDDREGLAYRVSRSIYSNRSQGHSSFSE